MTTEAEVTNVEILSDNWYVLRKYTYTFTGADGQKKSQVREVYDRGNGATIMLYNEDKQTVILTRQFRLPTFVNGNQSGMMIEACAGLLDADNPEDCILRESEEETGYRVRNVKRVFEAYMSPGSVSEILYFFTGMYDDSMKVGAGGGLEEEQENIEVMEVKFRDALQMIKSGEICDAKTIMLLQHLALEGILSK
jgi:GDP-mannose pyrophosphatase NudK